MAVGSGYHVWILHASGASFKGTLTLTVNTPGATTAATALELGGLGHFTTLPVAALE